MRHLFAASLCLALPFAAFGQSTENYNPAETLVSNPPSSPAVPQAPLGNVLFDNGPFVTGIGTGPGGSDLSVLQNPSLGMLTLGFGNQLVNGNRMSDQFEVTDSAGWRLDQVVIYSYQTGSTTTSTIDSVNVRIYDGPPNDVTSNVVFGDTTTNRFVSTSWSGAYRVTETTLTATNRPIMATVVNLEGIELDPGTYWLDWNVGGTLASGPWQPPITIIGQAVTGDALQFIPPNWNPANDTGTGTPQQGVPFTLLGEVVLLPGVLELSTTSLNFGNLAIGSGSSSTLTLSNTGTGPLNVTSIDGPAAPFAITGGTCGAPPIALAAGASCTLTISFNPVAVGNFLGTLTINTDIPSAVTVNLSGAGAVPPPAFIPASSDLSRWLLLGLLAVLGFVALRQRMS